MFGAKNVPIKMKMSKKSLLSHVTVATVFLLIGMVLMYSMANHKIWFIEITETFKDYSGRIDVKVTRADGSVEEYSNDNLVVTIGLTQIRDSLGFSNASGIETNATDDIALSNDATPLASWTKLPNEVTGTGLQRADAAAAVINSTAFQVQHTFTATGTVTIQCAGLHWSSVSDSDNNLFAAATFSQVTLNDNEQIQITWTINLQSG